MRSATAPSAPASRPRYRALMDGLLGVIPICWSRISPTTSPPRRAPMRRIAIAMRGTPARCATSPAWAFSRDRPHGARIYRQDLGGPCAGRTETARRARLSMLSQGDIDALARGAARRPVRGAGLHADIDGKLRRRALLPGAASVELLDAASGKSLTDLLHHRDGFFEARVLLRRKRFDYRLKVRWHDGGEAKCTPTHSRSGRRLTKTR